MAPSEQELIAAAQADKTAFVALYDEHFDAIHRFLLTRVADRQLAEDLTSETFMSALENIQRYRYEGKPFRAWLYRIAINQMNSHFRKHKREMAQLQEEWHEMGEQFEATDEALKGEEDQKMTLEQIQHLNLVFRNLRPDDQDVLSLRYFDDLSYQEIAAALNTSVNHVGVKLNRALGRLSKLCNFPAT